MTRLLSTKQLAEAIGVSESSLRRWVDDGTIRATKTAGGHRRVPLSEAIRFIRQSHAAVVKPSVLGLPDAAATTYDDNALPKAAEQVFEALQRGDGDTAHQLIVSLYLSGCSLPAIFDETIAEAMHRIGTLWQHGPEGVYIEHQATDACVRSVNQLRQLFPPLPEDAPVALGGAPDGDPYTLPSLLAATTLADAGYREMNLGANTPSDAMCAAIARRRPQLVWLSVTAPMEAEQLHDYIAEVADTLKPTGGSLVVGGRRVDDAVVRDISHTHRINSMTELAAFAKGLLASATG